MKCAKDVPVPHLDGRYVKRGGESMDRKNKCLIFFVCKIEEGKAPFLHTAVTRSNKGLIAIVISNETY